MDREWGGRFPPGKKIFSLLMPDFPIGVLKLDEAPCIGTPGDLRYSADEWQQAIVARHLVYDDGRWVIIVP